jgi:predicted CoA-binding protein
LLEESRRIAVLGIKPESNSDRPAHYVPRYLADVGYEVIPVPVYYPDVTQILGRPAYRSLSAIPGPVDIVNVFRRPEHIMQHLPDLLAKRPRAVWMQSGIRHDEAAARLTEAGIVVVQDRCLMVDHRRLLVNRPTG